ncbi:hypothetical protein TVAG_021830 [Trichomonas vaginalis G3]|uniref:Uncharacterized protein n=1 Tax=Trichomonas vaginalis (strain ATCC PRA-98 / G3) TaxID=412133 RepID=A2DHG3_TRIV3|nr:hypothetical protein TVAGG3_0678610 [Trichomonas vaginalis G3]EAY20236.1 hypothetical protein TVAG_021830 [Trichomonas vaginalis G3]KAI5507731.1 hypothetical protein TVAGG3_0678610 [Trichomonas vaginalis G3]|eukprot:XP_001581222.1 hypothetical protein [Trichomonas vaginalis G3]
MNRSKFPSPRISYPSVYSQRTRFKTKKFPKSAREKYLPPLEEPIDEFHDPLTLENDKRLLLEEIEQIKSEIKPLNAQIDEFQKQYFGTSEEGPQSPRSMALNTQKYISAQVANLHTEQDELCIELARVRRLYSEKTQNKLNFDINYQRSQLNDLTAEYNQLTAQINISKNELDQLMASDSTYLIQNQAKQIQLLQNTLSQLQADESEMIQKYMSLVNDVPQVAQTENILAQKKRQLITAEHTKIRFSVELRKLRKEYDDQISYLEREIADRENQAQIKQNRDNWRKILFEPSRSRQTNTSSVPAENTTKSIENNNQNQANLAETNNEEEEMLDIKEFIHSDTFFADQFNEISHSLIIPSEK